MHPGRELADVVQSVAGVVEGLSKQPPGGRLVLAQLLVGELEAHHRADQPLLDTIMEIACEAAPRSVTSGDDARARGDQLTMGGRVRYRGGDQVCEARQAQLCVAWQWRRSVSPGDQGAPDLPVEDHWRADLGGNAELAQPDGQGTGNAFVTVDPARSPGPLDEGIDRVAVERQAGACRDMDAA